MKRGHVNAGVVETKEGLSLFVVYQSKSSPSVVHPLSLRLIYSSIPAAKGTLFPSIAVYLNFNGTDSGFPSKKPRKNTNDYVISLPPVVATAFPSHRYGKIVRLRLFIARQKGSITRVRQRVCDARR